MDAQRFDNLARSLASRLSRRGALRRAGAAASATVLAAAGVRAAPAAALAQGEGQPFYTVIRRYSLADPPDAVRQALLQGYVEDACKAPGFVAYFSVEDEDGDFSTVAVFSTQQDFENFANAEANWIAQNLGDLLPAPEEVVAGQTFIHSGNPQAFRNTCAGGPPPPPAPPAPTTAPGAPTSTPGATATAAPPPPPPAPAPCTAQGCVCTTGTQSPCDGGLICCPTTDRMGGPGVCQPEAVCFPNQCASNGAACAATCAWGDACPSCCTNFCNSGGQCDNLPVGCTGAGCACTTGTQAPCDAGLICCGTSGVPGGPGICTAQTDCGTPCTGANCTCNPSNANSCDQGLTCCAVQSGYICVSSAQCGPPCTSENCACTTGIENACDAGLVCCGQGGGPGGPGICLTENECSPPCSSEGCACIGGTQGACDNGLVCCAPGSPGAPGTCLTQATCTGSACTSVGCSCTPGAGDPCDGGLVCCSQGFPGAPATCQAPADCQGTPTCGDIGTACDQSCAWGDTCPSCCSGYCNATGQCDNTPGSCTSAGCTCTGGTAGACDAGLVCCTGGGPGSAGTCETDAECSAPNCTDIGGTCDDSCAWGDTCGPCCSGFCNSSGLCDFAPASCTSAGCACTSGTDGPCDDGLVCCQTTDTPGGPGVCQAGC